MSPCSLKICSVIQQLLPSLQLQFLFTNELSASDILVLCSDQKYINVSYEKINIKIEIMNFSNNRVEIDRN